jgi:quinol monooxygenase YgiN
MSIVVVATITPQDGKLSELTAAFEEATPLVQKEPGCIAYALYSDGVVLVTIERWESDAALDAHMQAPALQALLARAGGILAGAPEIRTLNDLGFGDVVAGA